LGASCDESFLTLKVDFHRAILGRNGIGIQGVVLSAAGP
jgi:hypothetical protein